MSPSHPKPPVHSDQRRQAAMALFARADVTLLETTLHHGWPDLVFHPLKPATTGLVMVRGKTGGDGAAFNLGEATVSKSVIALEGGTRGYGQCLGRNGRKAELAAVFDALFQLDPVRVDELVLKPAREAANAALHIKASQTAATKVDFFTLVRGEDAQ